MCLGSATTPRGSAGSGPKSDGAPAAMVGEPIDKAELAKVRLGIDRAQPFGGDSWTGTIGWAWNPHS